MKRLRKGLVLAVMGGALLTWGCERQETGEQQPAQPPQEQQQPAQPPQEQQQPAQPPDQTGRQ